MQRSRQPETGPGSYDVTSRHEQVLGDGPRIDPLANDQVDAQSWDLVNRLRESAGAGRTSDMPAFMRLMAKHRAIFHRQMKMGKALFNGSIPARERELAVLRISWLAGAAYEWGEHVEIGKRVALSADEIERVTQGSEAPGGTAHEAAILRAVEELLADARIGDQTWNILQGAWSEEQ